MNTVPTHPLREQKFSKTTVTMAAWIIIVVLPAIAFVRYEQVEAINTLRAETLKVSESTRYRTCVEKRRTDYIETQLDRDAQAARLFDSGRIAGLARIEKERVNDLREFKKKTC